MKRRNLTAKKPRAAQKESRKKLFHLKQFSRSKNLCLSVLICGFISSFALFLFLNFTGAKFSPFLQKVSAEESADEMENALFTRQEFFGAQAVVPLPTAEARENLAELAEAQPDNLQILEKLAELDEKLSRFEATEKSLIRLAETDNSKNETLAAFYHRRAEFEKEAEVLRKILFSIEPEKRGAVFERLIDLARIHDLKNYTTPDFYAAVARENPNVYAVFERLIDNLVEEKNYAEALNFARQAKLQFPERQSVLLEKEIGILLETNRAKEAETVYQSAFNPFWSATEAQKFYDFLSAQDRLRAYGAEVRARFKKNPADSDAAIRLALYQNHDYEYGNDEIAPVILRLEAAKKSWTTDELATITRLLLQANEGNLASRFLYTLYARDDFQKNGELRAKVLYQLFEMFSDAENQKLPLTKGDLRFYEDVAKADANPGIATGILSLIFSDTNPRQKLESQETEANKPFNRATAYRVFEEFKREFPNSPELFQMYLDIVRLYAATKETEIAEKNLDEFQRKYENASDYAGAALKLADAFTATGKEEKARETYRKVLDYLGKSQKSKRRIQTVNQTDFSNDSAPETAAIAPDRNDGINIPVKIEKSDNEYYDREPTATFRDYLARKNVEISYEEVLDKLVASFVKEKKTAEILAVYSDEINKYPNEEWLYERRLTWLEQTNLTAEQLQVYKTALARFQTNNWRDKLARFFLREKRNGEFAEFSADLIGKLNDEDARDYLSQFVDGKISAGDFDKQLYLKLYAAAHRRFPRNASFVGGLLRFYRAEKREDEWRKLAAEYYFESPEIRAQFLDRLAESGELRGHLAKATGENIIYELFRADASARLSDYENAVAAYEKLNRIYPNTPEFVGRLIDFTRSFGQKNRDYLIESASFAQSQSDFEPSRAEYRTRGGEIYAELGDYQKSNREWAKLIAIGAGNRETYLDAATVYWDYFQYDDALRTIKNLREKFADETLYAFETGAILEAQHKQAEAVGEYVKALGAKDIDEDTQKEKAKKRLVQLAAKYANETDETDVNLPANERETNEKKQAENQKDKLVKIVDAAFLNEQGKNKDGGRLVLGYAEFLAKIKRTERAGTILNQAIGQSGNREFLEAAKEFYQTEENSAGEQTVLRRLAETAKTPRQAIAYRLQLAESFEENRQRDQAKIVLNELVRKFPLNYGVLTEASDFYRRLGFETESAQILQNALPQSKGAYRTLLAQKLAARLINLDRLDSAAQILLELHEKDKANQEIFAELARIFVRRNDAASLRKTFSETVAALKQTDGADRRELDEQIAGLRTEMIDAFTRLKDYQSAVEQHIEIINREPEDEETTESAIRYVERYGGAETLVAYYEKTSAEAFKNYRWNVVLARIYAAKNDFDNAVKNYQTAIVNQPEMPELYLAIADIETKRNNFGEALKNLDTVLELTNDQPQYVKKKIEILKRAGRTAEIAAERAKLPAEEEKKITIDQFAEARNLAATEKEKARELYREAFAQLLENPLTGDLKAANITAYVQSVREEEPLDKISERLWTLRGKLTAISDENDSTNAGEARKRLSVLDGALTDSVGTIAKTVGTDDELKNLHEDLKAKIEAASFADDTRQTLALAQNLSRRAGFGDLEERILLKRLEETNSAIEKQIYLEGLANFYDERAAYQRTFDALERYGNSNLPLAAAAARRVGNAEKELAALRRIYWEWFDNISLSPDGNVDRYLEILESQNRDELKSLTEKSSAYQLQLINFLLGRGERELAHAAIGNAHFSEAWKISRNAETSLALKEFGENAECYFCEALQFERIGEMVKQTPDKKHFLINDDWFRLTREYGEWLKEKMEPQIGTDKHGFSEAEADKYLAAMTENQPENADEQYKLGVFYLERNDLKNAIEHLRLAIETENYAVNDKSKPAALGAAYYKIGRRDYAEEVWAKMLADESIESGAAYFQTLQKYGLAAEAREKLPPIIVKFLTASDADDSPEFQSLIRAAAESFGDDAEKSAYFLRILERRPTDTSLAAALVNENLIAKKEQPKFFDLLVSRGDKTNSADYNFTSAVAKTWTNADAESVYEQENDYEIEESKGERDEWRKKYLELLVEQHEDVRAKTLAGEIEKDLAKRYARPAWLRLAEFQLQIRDGKFDETELERFVGIAVSGSVAEIKPPSIERFNDVVNLLREENRETDAGRISESFFARNLALGQFDAANFVGLARTLFQTGDAEKAQRVLQLMIDAGNDAKKETAFGEIASLDVVKRRGADAAKSAATETNGVSGEVDALRRAAELCAEVRQIDRAINFRRQIAEANPSDRTNRLELAKLLVQNDEKWGATNLLTEVVNDRSAPRLMRWQARMLWREMGANIEIPNNGFDVFAQFYQGIIAAENSRTETAAEFFINSLIADKEAETSARQELVKIYAVSGKFYAALKIAEADKSQKSDELLETLSGAAEKVGDFAKALEFERTKSNGGNAERIASWQNALDGKNRRATDLTVDRENTRKL